MHELLSPSIITISVTSKVPFAHKNNALNEIIHIKSSEQNVECAHGYYYILLSTS